MKKKANEITPGEVIRVEYGDYENWVDFMVDQVEVRDQRIIIFCIKGVLHVDFPYLPNDLVEVVE